MLSFLLISLVFILFGFYSVWEKVKDKKALRLIFLCFVYFIAILTIYFKIRFQAYFLISYLVIVGLILYLFYVKNLKKVIVSVLLITFFYTLYFIGFSQSIRFLTSAPKKSLYVAAKWFNNRQINMKVGVIGQHSDKILKFYLKKNIKVKSIYFKNKTNNISDKEYWDYIKKRIRYYKEKSEVKYLIIDNYYSFVPNKTMIPPKMFFYRMKKEGRLREVGNVRELFYKRKNVGFILKIKTKY